MAAQGFDVTVSAPASMSPLEKSIADAEQLIAADPALTFRPMERKLLMELLTRPLRNIDGTPVKDKAGKQLPGTAWDAVIGAEILRAANGDAEARERIWQTVHGKPRQGLELSGPGGGPIATTTKLDGISSDEMAERMRRALEIVGIAPSGARQEDPVEMIEVSAHELPAQDATTEPVSIPATAAMGMATKPATPPQQAQSVLPMTGMIPVRR
jgi:hypothetical protein